ncbi:MAG: cysteine desulfurase [Candidatus Eremiobacteraeota bacterium]|nr:cysteine desulfurase [Candidatus Eremiobacteraeota bacterium]
MRTEVIDAMHAALSAGNYNPSSAHAEGRAARALLDSARDRIASALHAGRTEVTFTGSGTEADILAIEGVVRALAPKGHVITSAIEHHAVLHAMDGLREKGYEVTILPVDSNGRIDAQQFEASIRTDTLLASVMYANNEVGTIEPIGELVEIAHAHGVVFHSDAVQAPVWLPIDVAALKVDLLSLSAHKFYGPKGVGILYVRRGTPIVPILPGGGQEFGRRSGTENVTGVAGAAAALTLASTEREAHLAKISRLRDRLEAGIAATISGARVNAAGALRLPNIASVSFVDVDAEALLVRLDLEGIAASAGSACTSGVFARSHVIAALGHGAPSDATIRFSLGISTTSADIERVLAVLPPILASVRRSAPASA